MTSTISGDDQSRPLSANGLLDRRLFLRGGLGLGLMSLLSPVFREAAAMPGEERIDSANPPWMHRPGSGFSTYGMPSRFESQVLRFPTSNPDVPGNGVSWTPLHRLEGTITPNGLHFERHHNGVPEIVPEQHRLLIHGLVNKPLFFRVEDLLRYPMTSKICFVECGGNSNAGWNKSPIRSEAGYFHGLVSNSEWCGIPLAVLLREAGVASKASWIIAEGADAFAMQISIPLEKGMEDAMLALYQNGERLRPENGYPMRLILPGWEGVMNVKWLRRLKLTDRPVMARNETARYTDLLPNGKARMFTTVMEAKSLITSPSANMRLEQKGIYPVTGLAWSGNGKISRVDVSADGGESWKEAELQEPVLSKAFTRFRIPWRWEGQPAIIQSRAIDETGYQQPEREKLVAERGRHGFFHYNAIVSWQVDEFGVVSHVYDQDQDTENTRSLDIDTGWD